MPLVFVDRNGHPEALQCPMVICDVCAKPIMDGQNGFAARWRGVGAAPVSSPVYFVHSNPSQRCLPKLERAYAGTYRAKFGRAILLTSNLGEALEQLLFNFGSQIGGDGDRADAGHGAGSVEYVSPAVDDAANAHGPGRSWSAVVYADGEVRESVPRA